jgi:hypothetical protein
MKRNSLISCISVLGLTKNALFGGFGFVIARHAIFLIFCLFIYFDLFIVCLVVGN